MDLSVWFRFGICALAVWRLTHLLAAEDGPWTIIVRLRQALGNGVWGGMLDCFNCLSMWIGIPFSFYVTEDRLSRVMVALALSGSASLAERFAAQPVVFEPLQHTDQHGR